MKRLAIFVSGGGTDLQSVIDAIENGELRAQIAVVVAGKSGIYAIARARNAGIPVMVYEKDNYNSPGDMDAEIVAELEPYAIDYIVLAGYLNILTPVLVQAYPKRIINIHPALLPKFGGKGYYGMRVHRAVIQNREKVSGATVHYVDEGTDTGEIIAQAKVPVYPYDTPETLQARVLEAEHVLLPKTLQKILNEESI